MTSRYRIFISSTIDDLQEVRISIDEELRSIEIFEPVRVENLPAADQPSRRVCLDEVAAADALVLVLNDRYGFVPAEGNPENLSVTHLEYRHAKHLDKPVFAFLRDGIAPEPRLASFIQEVGDFDEGVLRKKWASGDQLRSEVRRALLFWVARLGRKAPSENAQRRISEQLVGYPELTELLVTFSPEPDADEIQRDWYTTFLERLSQDCRQRLLPVPRGHEMAGAKNDLSTLSLRIRPTPQKSRLTVTIDISDRQHRSVVPIPLEIEVARTPEGARFAAQCSLALVLLAADDWPACIDQLFAASQNRNATDQTQAWLIANAGYISAQNQGQRSMEVVRRMLILPKLTTPTVSAGVMSLISAELRLRHLQAQHALAEVEQLALRLLTLALEHDPASAETLYNLARQVLHYSPWTALAFYKALLRTDPSYDERWYFHRDLGLIYYGHGRYRDAARHYDLACHQKDNDSELFRYAGDAYYYEGYWAEALLRYERAVDIERIEAYFLDGKISFLRSKIRSGKAREASFLRKRNLSHAFSRLGLRTAQAGWQRIASWLFGIAKRLCAMNFDADTWLALYANRRGAYEEAIEHLKGALTARPEDASTRLNLVMNLIFQNKGLFANDSRIQAKIAIFHGGPETHNRFRLRLTNTENRDDLCRQFEKIFEEVMSERKGWVERRREILKPEAFGDAIHFEFRQ